MNIRLLHWGRSWEKLSRSGKWQFEYHPYCQLEVCVRGKLLVRLPDREYGLQANDMLLIPPGIGHNVAYPDGGNEFYSLKFEASQSPENAIYAPASRFNAWCIRSFQQCHSAEAQFLLPIDPESREIVEGLLMLAMQRLRRKSQPSAATEPEIFKKIRVSTLTAGGCINVNECAARLKMNAAQLNYQFAKELKNFNLSADDYSVKKIIDEAVLYLIDRYLDFTEFSLGTIARQLRFNNVYTFSRYYKRLTGISPSERRKK